MANCITVAEINMLFFSISQDYKTQAIINGLALRWNTFKKY